MPYFNLHEARSNLSRLLTMVEHGEKVTIMRRGKPVADLVRHRLLSQATRARAAADRLLDIADRGPHFTVDPASIRRGDLHERR
jgi:antitoxin (DNA-binding transcriptional repressor) of toxin-antitoxin stability system